MKQTLGPELGVLSCSVTRSCQAVLKASTTFNLQEIG